MESWVLHQFLPNSVAAKTYSLMLQSMPTRDFNGDRRYFSDMAEFKQALYDRFFFSKPIHIVVPEAIRKLHVGQDAAGLPTLLALSNQAKELYALLPNGPAEEAQVELVKNLLPGWVQRELISSQSHMGKWITSFNDLDRCLALYDEEYSRKRQLAVPNTNYKGTNQPRTSRPPIKHQRNKWFRQSHPPIKSAPPSQSRFSSSNNKPPYTGICDGCGAKGHSILKCFKTPQYAKDKWIEKVKINKQKKQNNRSANADKNSNHSVNALINALASKLNTAATAKESNVETNPTH